MILRFNLVNLASLQLPYRLLYHAQYRIGGLLHNAAQLRQLGRVKLIYRDAAHQRGRVNAAAAQHTPCC